MAASDLSTTLDRFRRDLRQPRVDAAYGGSAQRRGPLNRERKGHLQNHAIELVIDRLSRGQPNRKLSPAEQLITTYATDAVRLHEQLTAAGRQRFEAALSASMTGSNGFIGVFHLMRTAALQRSASSTSHSPASTTVHRSTC